VQFRLQVQEQKFGALGFDDGYILPGNHVLKLAHLLVWNGVIIPGNIGPGDGDALRDRDDGEV